MEPTVLVMLFAGLTILSSWLSVPLTSLNPQRPMAERLAASFQLTAAAQGVSTLCCRFNQPEFDFLSVLNQTLLFTTPEHRGPHAPSVAETQAEESTPTAMVSSLLIPTPTTPFGGACHIMYDGVFDNDSEYPEWFLGKLRLLVEENMRRHPNIYTVATVWFFLQVIVIKCFSRRLGKLTYDFLELQRQHLKKSGVTSALEPVRERFVELEIRVIATNDKLSSLEGRLNDLMANISESSPQFPKQMENNTDEIKTRVDQLVTQLEQLQNQVFNLTNVSETSQHATEIETRKRFPQPFEDRIPELKLSTEHFEERLETNVSELERRLEHLNNSINGDISKLSSRVQDLQTNFNRWKESMVSTTHYASLETDFRMLKQTVDANKWALPLDEVKDNIGCLNQEFLEFKESSFGLKSKQDRLASDINIISQYITQLQATQPWKQADSAADSHSAIVADIKNAKQKIETLSNTIRCTEDTIDLKLKESSKEMERMLRVELDNLRKQSAALETVHILSTRVDELGTRAESCNSEMLKVKEIAKEAENSAIGTELTVRHIESKLLKTTNDIEGCRRTLVFVDRNLVKVADETGVTLINEFDPPSKAEVKVEEPQIPHPGPKEAKLLALQDSPASKDSDAQRQQFDKKDETPSTGSALSESNKSLKEAELIVTPPEAPTPASDDSKQPGLEASKWAPAKPKESEKGHFQVSESATMTRDTQPEESEAKTSITTDPKDLEKCGLGASKWATAALDPRPVGLEASQWATSDPPSSAGKSQKKGNSSKKGKKK
ncbi:hypothetical protein LOZ53_003605 [Ophidiomyces ophidiicola]|nr:hypothetical protein LOZ55_000685 [Ophidiomyces ophidiicola]KAI1989433.1 hypothetical protein LOZ53_003605 [Ophidiomyces ophidiicola]KAI1993221.1 hypothetical protein LOZ54_001423 [Ophidiomyces ophidiicola]